jgi:DNA (cytosine-5)-methyltransferase 1
MVIRILEAFSGYGTATHALKRIGVEHELVGFSDIDPYANKCFRQNHYKPKGKCENCGTFKDGVEYRDEFEEFQCGLCFNGEDTTKELGDIKLIDPNNLDDFDLLTGGFPCTSFSAAGKGLGELDPRGTLVYEIIRIAEVKQPKMMLLENVKGFTFNKYKPTFDKVLSELDRIGYNVHWKVLNSRDYGVPQNRERVWFVCFRKDLNVDFEWPKPLELTKTIKDLLEDEVDEKYYLAEKWQNKFNDFIKKKNIELDSVVAMRGRNIDNPSDRTSGSPTEQRFEPKVDGCSNSITSVQKDNLVAVKGIMNLYSDKFCERNVFDVNGISPTLKVGGDTPMVCPNVRLRRLTPKECFRIQGFFNDEINLEGLSDTRLYKLAGNGQDVNVVSLILKEMFKDLMLSKNTGVKDGHE